MNGCRGLGRRWPRYAAAVLLGWVATLMVAFPVAAQDFVKVEDGSREQLPATPFVGVAYGIIWVALLLYLFVVARGVARVQKDLAELRRRLDRPAPGESPGADNRSPPRTACTQRGVIWRPPPPPTTSDRSPCIFPPHRISSISR